MLPEQLRVHRFLNASRSNGPGLRAVLWVQGCSLGCPGCFNPDTHSQTSGDLVCIDQLAEEILLSPHNLAGVTISGGEPFQQAKPLANLLTIIRAKSSLSILVFSGFTWEQLKSIPGAQEVIVQTDVLISGRYLEKHRLAQAMLGSSNKKIHLLSNRYTVQQIQEVPEAEVLLEPNGEITLSGINPLQW